MDECVALSTTDESFLSHNSSLSGEARCTVDDGYLRFEQLEKKISEQADEIVCLKSTLADVVRRLSQLEGRACVTTSVSPANHPHFYTNGKANHHYSGRTGTFTKHTKNGNGLGPQYSDVSLSTVRRQYSSSSTSLQNELSSPGTVSPVSSSPLPSNASSLGLSSYRSKQMGTLPAAFKISHSATMSKIHQGATTPNSHLYGTHHNNNNSNLKQMRRWSASQDFNQSNFENSRRTSGSLLNLHALRNVQNADKLRVSVKDFYYDQVEGILRFVIENTPVVIHIPTESLNSYVIKNVIGPPTQRLKLEWVYGYRGKDCRHNLYLLPTGEIVYFLASVVVLYNVDDQIQRHYTGHTGEIRAIAIHPNKLLIATGQGANPEGRTEKRAHIRIWDSVSLNTSHIIGLNGEFDRGISCLTFSKHDGGNLLGVVDESYDHTVSLWEWQKSSNGHRLSEVKSTIDPVLAVEFHPTEKFTMITIGRGHIFFWDTEGGTLVKKIGAFDKLDKPKYLLCMAFNQCGELLTGDSNGNIIVWMPNSNRITRTLQGAHDGPIFDICVLKDGCVVTGGGKDKRIVEWDSRLNRTGREAKLPDQFGGIRTLTTGKGSMIIVGTTKNCILQGTMELNFSLVIQGHTEEVFAMAIHPTQNQFVSGGYDKMIHLWDTMSHLVVWSKDIAEGAHSAAFSPDGSVLVVATTVPSKWMILDATTRQLISMHNDGADLIETIKFSSDGHYLALASRDRYVYIYQVTEEYRKFNRIGRCMGHTAQVISIDWDVTNTYIQTVASNHEHMFWNATTCRQLHNMSIARDLDFESHQSTLGFNVFGVWPDSAGNANVNCCDRSNTRKLIVTGDENGRVNLFSYPACQPKCLHHSYPGHSQPVMGVRFLTDDSRIITIGGRDSSIMQWSVS